MEMQIETAKRQEPASVIKVWFGRATRRPFEWLALLRLAFAGAYVPGTSTDVGAAIIYSLLFGTLLVVDAGRFRVDAWIEKRWPVRRRVAEVRVRP